MLFKITQDPEIVQNEGVVETTLTGSPEVAETTSEAFPEFKALLAIAVKEMVCTEAMTLKETQTEGAGK